MEPRYNANQGYPDKDPPSQSDAPLLSEASDEKHQRLFQRGLKWLGVGIFFMAISFAINFFLFDSDQPFLMSMYVLTSLGAAFIMKGLVDMLGF